MFPPFSLMRSLIYATSWNSDRWGVTPSFNRAHLVLASAMLAQQKVRLPTIDLDALLQKNQSNEFGSKRDLRTQ